MNHFATNADLTDAISWMRKILVFSERPWSDHEDEAMLYAIIVGWGPAMLRDLSTKYGWHDESVEAMQRAHDVLEAAKLVAKEEQ